MHRLRRTITVLAAAGSALVLVAACEPSATPEPTQSPGGTVTTTTTATATATPATMTVVVYFDNQELNPDAADCGQVYGVPRTVPASDDVLTAAMEQLLAGPTSTESAQGYTSWFSSDTAEALVSAKVSGDTAYVDLADIRTTIPNASTSCGSEALLAQLDTTAQQAAMTPEVRYAIDGQPQVFWGWLQMGCDASNDNCDPAPFS